MAPFVSAPVSRGGDHYVVGGEHEPSASSVRLSKAEREHAAAAGVSDKIYAREKLRMMKPKNLKQFNSGSSLSLTGIIIILDFIETADRF